MLWEVKFGDGTGDRLGSLMSPGQNPGRGTKVHPPEADSLMKRLFYLQDNHFTEQHMAHMVQNVACLYSEKKNS